MSEGVAERRERFEAIYRELYAPICGYTLRRVRDPEDAAEVIAETFVTLWRRFDRCPEGEQLRPWLFGVARRVIANQRRGDRRRSGQPVSGGGWKHESCVARAFFDGTSRTRTRYLLGAI